MQRELRQLLEYKAAQGGDYYYDMSGQGELAAGKRKRKHKKMTPMQKKMAHVRAGKKRRGGDFVDLDNLQPYQGAGRKKAGEKAFRNPIEKAERDILKQEYNEDWITSYGPEYAARLRKKADLITRALNQTRMNEVGRIYEDQFKRNEGLLSAYQPYTRAASKYGMKLAPIPVPDAADLIPYRVALGNARRGVRGVDPYAGVNEAAILAAALAAHYM